MNLAIFIRLRKRDNKYKACASVKNGKNQVISSNGKCVNIFQDWRLYFLTSYLSTCQAENTGDSVVLNFEKP